VLGADLAIPETREKFSRAALDQGLVIDWFLFKPATFRIAPPLTITDDEAREACRRLKAALDTLVPA